MIVTSGIMDLSKIDLSKDTSDSKYCAYCMEEINVGDDCVEMQGEVTCSLSCMAHIFLGEFTEGTWGEDIGVDDND